MNGNTSAFENGYVYYENGKPILMRAETTNNTTRIKKKKSKNITSNQTSPPVLDGYVLYEDGVPVMIFADPFSSDDEGTYSTGEELEDDDEVELEDDEVEGEEMMMKMDNENNNDDVLLLVKNNEDGMLSINKNTELLKDMDEEEFVW